MIEVAFDELAPLVRTRRACRLLGKSHATHYRRRKPPATRPPSPRPTPPNALSPAERQAVLDALHRPDHADLAPAEGWARLLDEGTYLASISTMYRLLGAAGESRDRRRQRTHPARTKPQLLATEPNDVWSWDLTKLPGPARHEFYELYAIIDIFSRYVPGWLVAPAESAELAKAPRGPTRPPGNGTSAAPDDGPDPAVLHRGAKFGLHGGHSSVADPVLRMPVPWRRRLWIGPPAVDTGDDESRRRN